MKQQGQFDILVCLDIRSEASRENCFGRIDRDWKLTVARYCKRSMEECKNEIFAELCLVV